ncbi:MAG: phytoene desaturase family protein [Candidatus Limnocylindrales bacterium]
MRADTPDAIVVGSGPNGLAAAITLARAGRSVVVYESHATVGGGMRSAELTLPGFIHDICSTVQGTSTASPFFRDLDLARHGVELIDPPAPIAHPLDGGRAAMLERSVDATASGLGADGAAYRRLMGPLVRDADKLMDLVLAPIFRVPRHPLAAARFGLPALGSAVGLARGRFRGDEARALLTGLSAHSMLRLDRPVTASFGLVLAITAHAYGWPIVRGGTQRLADALADELRSLGGEIITGHPVTSMDELPTARAVLFDTAPRAFSAIAGVRLPGGYRRRLDGFRYGPGIVKVDWALSMPIPWRAEGAARAGTVHVGGSMDEIRASEAMVSSGRHPERPFVIVVQGSRFDPSRAPEGQHTGWAYCHVPSGSTFDMTDRMEAQVERFAPGFRDTILARSIRLPADIEADNANYVGGDINGGIQDLRQLFTRPVARLDPYSTPTRGIYLCSSSTPPGGGVHGMCGVWAARSALRREFGDRI